MTEVSFCDFVLDSGIGDPHIERIFNDLEIQSNLSINTYKFWKHVMVPEYFFFSYRVFLFVPSYSCSSYILASYFTVVIRIIVWTMAYSKYGRICHIRG